MTRRVTNLRWFAFLTAAGASLGLSACTTAIHPSTEPAQQMIPKLSAGDYVLTMYARTGSKAGASTSGTLHLVAARPDDQSPKTGQKPWPQWADDFPFYGWANIDLLAVGAPIYPDEAPPVNSHDPITPGVLVTFAGPGDDYPAATPVLLIGTIGQTRNPVTGSTESGDEIITLSTDGSGIGMWVTRVTEAGFRGVWREYGIIYDGRGYFSAIRATEESGAKR